MQPHEASPWTASYGLNTGTYPLPESLKPVTQEQSGGPLPDILDRPRDRTRSSEVNVSSLQFLFAQMVTYAQERVNGISEFERLLASMGVHVGYRMVVLWSHRIQTSQNPKKPKRETRLLPTLLWIHSTLWKSLFGMQADSLERSAEQGRGDEYMISSNNPLFSRAISIPKEMDQLSVEAFVAGIVEGALDGLGFPARVTAHSVPTEQFPNRTTILIKLDPSVMERETTMGGP
ncbi:Trafficking protein particle complex subunit 31 [Malassezia vespertilionis]|uniref:Trafficking protein particle complex subunit n=1 Tax=Malassezia vespertilionis TaxID=2020962 RepID=A0A2N1JGR0_9BASI|nr:Trafficking protein particle complex subunit 31 [Malassezia vespertilionis]PKI85734.1 Trs31p [Malassezia vespertilionis]WFD05372.1 Trafficking protein particle complex subunit 31 [Malassezia vespertilionis]